jgi:hypothetical protein
MVHLRGDRRRSGLCIPPHTAFRYLARGCHSWWLVSGEPRRKGAPEITFSSTSEGTPRELREPYLAESDPVPRRSRLGRFLNASWRPLVPCVERWNESCAAQWRPRRLGCDVPECHVLSKTRALHWPHRLRSVPVRSSGRSVPDRANPRHRQELRIWSRSRPFSNQDTKKP